MFKCLECERYFIEVKPVEVIDIIDEKEVKTILPACPYCECRKFEWDETKKEEKE